MFPPHKKLSLTSDTKNWIRQLLFPSYPTLPYPTLPYPTLPYPTLPYPTPTLPYPTLASAAIQFQYKI